MRITKNGHTVSDTVCKSQVINQRFAGNDQFVGLVRCEIIAEFDCQEGDILEIFPSEEEIKELYEQYRKKAQLPSENFNS